MYGNMYIMDSIKITKARKDIFRLVEQVSQSHEPIKIVGKHNSVVMISEDDWKAIEETNYLNSIPHIAKTIKESMDDGIENAVKSIDW